MAAAKDPKPSALAKNGSLLRGAELVDEIIRHVESGKSAIEVAEPHPVSAAALAKLTFVGGAKLPPSLVRWLAFDASWWMQTFHHFHDLARPVFQPISFAALVRREADDSNEYASVFTKLDDTPFRGPVVRLGHPAGASGDITGHALALHLGHADANGEHPIVEVDGDDEPRVVLVHAGLDLWLADRAGLLGSKEKKLATAALAAHAEHRGGAISAELAGRWRGLDAKKKRAWEGDEVAMEPWVDAEPADLANGDAPEFPITKPVPKLAEDRLATQLALAIERTQRARAEWLLDAALERFPKGAWRNEALLRACRHGRARWVKRLLAAGADPNAVIESTIAGLREPVFDSPLEWAANPWGHGEAVEITRMLLDAGADVNGGSKTPGAPIDTAVLRSQPRVLELLLSRGVDLERIDKHRQTILHRAANGGSDETEECAKLLIKAGAKIDALDAYGQTPLLSAVYDGKKKRATALALLAAGADPNLGKDVPFLVAFMKRDRALVAAMVKKVDRKKKHENGWCIDELCGDDVWLPKRFEIAYATSDKPQTLTITADVRSLEARGRSGDAHLPKAFDDAIRRFARVLSRGGYEPDAEATVTSKPFGPSAKPSHSLTWTLTVRGVSGQSLFAALSRLQTLERNTFVSALVVHGEAKATGAEVVDVARAEAWWLQPPEFRRHGALPFATTRGGTKMRATIDVVDPKKHKKALETVLDDWTESFTVREQLRGEPKLVLGAKSATLSWRDYDAKQPMPDPAFAALLGLLGKAHTDGVPITGVAVG